MRAPERIGRDLETIVGDIMRIDGIGKAAEPIVRLLAAGVVQLGPYPPLSGWATDNAKFATALRKWVNDGEKLFADPPEAFNFSMLFVPEIESDSETTEQIEARYGQAEARYEFLVDILATLRRRCGWVVDHRFGEHRASGFQQARAAIAAGELMEHCGLALAYASPTSAFCVTASLLFELTTGTFGADLSRACREVVHPTRTEKR
jgi:hypothetical protein